MPFDSIIFYYSKIKRAQRVERKGEQREKIISRGKKDSRARKG
jgi:hypothetical protein